MYLSNFKIVNMEHVKGDTMSFVVETKEQAKNVIFNVGKITKDMVNGGVIDLGNNRYLVRLVTADTSNSVAGNYTHQLTIETNNARYTVMRGTFTLIERG